MRCLQQRVGRTTATGSILVLAIVAGCLRQEGPERISVSGRVTFDGQPVVDGLIRFVPDAATAAPVTTERIQEGSYRTRVYEGVPVGHHRVEILAYDPQDPAPQEPGGRPRTQLLPSKYNRQSMLEITLKPGSPPVTRDFDLSP